MADPDELESRDLVLAETRRALEASFPAERAERVVRALELGWPATHFPDVLLRGGKHRVRLTWFEMARTYAGVLEGVPPHEPILSAARTWGRNAVHLIEPPLREVTTGGTAPSIRLLPAWRCSAQLRSTTGIRDGDYSTLMLRYFRDDAEPLFPTDAIRDLDWEALAEDGEY